MSVAWTKEQKDVIDVRGKQVLVSAAAGSGKTAVLVERICSLVCGEREGDTPLDVDKLLVVTFTNAAAAEMRERIGLRLEKKLEEDPENVHLQKQQTLIHNAQISTIHSFCQYVIRNYFHQLDLDPAFRIGDEGELKLLKSDVLKELLEDQYAQKRESFLTFVETYATGKRDEGLEELILQVYEQAISYPYPKRWLEDCRRLYRVRTKEELTQTGWMQFLLSFCKTSVENLQGLIQTAKKICGEPQGPYMYLDALQSDALLLKELAAGLDYESYRQALTEVKFARLSSKKDAEVSEEKKNFVKNLREILKKRLSVLKEEYFADSLEELLEQLEKTAPIVEELLFLTSAFADLYQEKKRAKNLADFSDLEHLALEILVKDVKETSNGLEITVTDAARELSEQYAHIMIDEYQDSNLIQEIVLNSVSKTTGGDPNVFMVGDVKQSIYRFRLARPELFMDKYHRYPTLEGEKEIRIDLHKNFRSRQEVITAVNDVFAQLMIPEVGGILYDEDAALYLGSAMPVAEESSMNQPEFLLVDLDEEELSEEAQDLTARELEAAAAADCIKRILKHNKVWDKELGDFRPARYSDIVILMRGLSGWGDVFANVLNAEGIPAHTESRTGYFTTTEIQTILNLLRVVDNPRQDIALAAVLKSMIGGFSDRELALVKSQFPKRPFYEACMRFEELPEELEGIRAKLAKFYENLDRYRSKAEYLSIHEFLLYVINDTGYGDYLAAQAAGEQREANVNMLLQKAIAFETTSYRGLFHFVRYIEQLQNYKEDFGEASLTGENENAVRIMTIHKSKGLEFPIVLVVGLGKSFNRNDSRKSMAIHPDLGLGVDEVNLTKRVKKPMLSKRILQKALDLEMLGEELRVLYVAFTRAQEKLILMGGVKNLDKKVENSTMREGQKTLSFLELANASTYMDWLIPVIAGKETTPFAMQRIVPEAQLETAIEEQAELEEQRMCLESGKLEGDEAYAKALERYLGFRYPYEEETSLRVKLSVSELKLAGQAEEEDAETFLYPQDEMIPYIPKFMQDNQPAGGAARGTAYHRALECLDISGLYHSERVKEALEQLVKEGKLDREQADLIRPYDIYLFAQTELGKRMAKARQTNTLHTEQPFVIQVPAYELGFGYQSDQPVLVQGIIDAYFTEEDELLIVDYKTDFVRERGELLKKYKKQLDYYGTALERLAGKKVKEKLIYSFCLQETILV